MPKLNISTNQINTFIDAMNHRMTGIEEKAGRIEIDVRWMKKLGYYMAGIITAIAIKLMFL
jgi:archaellum component FlaC